MADAEGHAQAEPDSVDRQVVLVVTLTRVAQFELEHGSVLRRRALSIITSLRESGALSPAHADWISLLERQLAPVSTAGRGGDGDRQEEQEPELEEQKPRFSG
ncbi:MAG: hypothetical protein M3O15_04415 [Acidobacteriota bacterium]|nr:hypothetical protein [Acidobacteriota bacterium]